MSKLTEQQVLTLARQYHELRKQKNDIDARMKELAVDIRAYAVENAPKDDNGNQYIDKNGFVLGQQVTKRVKLDEERALAYLKDRGYLEAISHVEVVDQDVLSSLVASGDVSFDDISAMTDVSVTEKIRVTYTEPEEEMPTIQTSRLKRRL